MNQPSDPDELRLAEAERRNDPRRVGDLLEKIEWRLQYGEYVAPRNLVNWLIVVLLSLILWRVW